VTWRRLQLVIGEQSSAVVDGRSTFQRAVGRVAQKSACCRVGRPDT